MSVDRLVVVAAVRHVVILIGVGRSLGLSTFWLVSVVL
jgi:hypothetical protein